MERNQWGGNLTAIFSPRYSLVLMDGSYTGKRGLSSVLGSSISVARKWKNHWTRTTRRKRKWCTVEWKMNVAEVTYTKDRSDPFPLSFSSSFFSLGDELYVDSPLQGVNNFRLRNFAVSSRFSRSEDSPGTIRWISFNETIEVEGKFVKNFYFIWDFSRCRICRV